MHDWLGVGFEKSFQTSSKSEVPAMCESRHLKTAFVGYIRLLHLLHTRLPLIGKQRSRKTDDKIKSKGLEGQHKKFKISGS